MHSNMDGSHKKTRPKLSRKQRQRAKKAQSKKASNPETSERHPFVTQEQLEEPTLNASRSPSPALVSLRSSPVPRNDPCYWPACNSALVHRSEPALNDSCPFSPTFYASSPSSPTIYVTCPSSPALVSLRSSPISWNDACLWSVSNSALVHRSYSASSPTSDSGFSNSGSDAFVEEELLQITGQETEEVEIEEPSTLAETTTDGTTATTATTTTTSATLTAATSGSSNTSGVSKNPVADWEKLEELEAIRLVEKAKTAEKWVVVEKKSKSKGKKAQRDENEKDELSASSNTTEMSRDPVADWERTEELEAIRLVEEAKKAEEWVVVQNKSKSKGKKPRETRARKTSLGVKAGAEDEVPSGGIL